MTAGRAQYLRGVNLSGAEFGEGQIPGTFNRDYTYNSENSFRYFAAKNLGLIRLPVRWERLQPAPSGPLDANNLTLLKRDIAWAASHGAKVIVDVHNYGRYRMNENGKLNEYVIDNVYGGVTKVSRADLADFWGRMAKEFRDEAAVYAYDLINEPHDMGSADWKAISQAAVMAIRVAGDNKLIMVPGNNWSAANTWAAIHGPTSWITDPANNFAYEAHQYFDSDNSGAYKLSYETRHARERAPRCFEDGLSDGRARDNTTSLSLKFMATPISHHGGPGHARECAPRRYEESVATFSGGYCIRYA